MKCYKYASFNISPVDGHHLSINLEVTSVLTSLIIGKELIGINLTPTLHPGFSDSLLAAFLLHAASNIMPPQSLGMIHRTEFTCRAGECRREATAGRHWRAGSR